MMPPDGADGAEGTQEQPLRKKDRERPLLLPSGRKLRHLNGIAIRNISEKVPAKLKGRSNDDTSIVGSWRSPKQILSVNVESTLTHSKSSSDLHSASLAAQEASSNASCPSGSLRMPGRRRRSTRVDLEDPVSMQRLFEEAPSARLPDTFFSLHHSSIGGILGQQNFLSKRLTNLEDPIYISEVVPKSANPTFQPFDLSDYGPAVTWFDSVVVKVWINTTGGKEFKLLQELDMSLYCLQFIGTAIENFRQPLPQNCIIFSLTDGIYTTLTDAPVNSRTPAPLRYRVKSQEEFKETSSYDSLMKLKNLEECIWDAKITRDKLSKSIEAILEREKDSIAAVRQVGQARDDMERAKKYLEIEQSQLESVIRQRNQLRSSIEARKAAVDKAIEQRKSTEKHLVDARVKLAEARDMLKNTREGITGQQRRVISELQSIYPIDPIPDKPLAFTIRGLHLPNTEFEDQNEDTIAAALGYTAHLVYLLSFYLKVYLRYPVQPFGSTSFIRDPISIVQGSRTFPLYPKGQVSYRFEYAVFLLNKNIEMLLSSQSVLVLDIRNTLPNLKYLFYIITSSGNTPIPDREWPLAPFRLRSHRIQNDPNSGKLTAGIAGKQPGTVSTSPISTIGDFSYPRLHRERSNLGLKTFESAESLRGTEARAG